MERHRAASVTAPGSIRLQIPGPVGGCLRPIGADGTPTPLCIAGPSAPMLTDVVDLTEDQLKSAKNWKHAYRDPRYAFGEPIPTHPDDE